MVIYLDYNATTPYENEVKSTILSAITHSWANPSSAHVLGRKAKKIVEKSREHIGQMINCPAQDVIFTSGGTESNNLAIEGAITNFITNKGPGVKPHIITSNIEHDSITLHLRNLVKKGIVDVTFIPVCKETAQIQVEDIKKEIRDETCLVTIMMANNETGIIQPLWEIGTFIDAYNGSSRRPAHSVLFHTDAAQAIGKIAVNTEDLNCDLLTIAGHKFYGPRIGALYMRDFRHRDFEPIFYGGGQESKIRPGTENVAMIAGLGKASNLVWLNLDNYYHYMTGMRDYLEEQLILKFEDKISFNNIRTMNVDADKAKRSLNEVPRLPNTVSVSFKGFNVTGAQILTRAEQVCASTGAACHCNDQISSVLGNCGVDKDTAAATLRLTVGRETTKSEIDEAVKFIDLALKN